MIYGLDVLGMAMFPSIAIKNWPTGFACGVFNSTFGNVWPALNRLAETGKCPCIRVQGPWTNHDYNPIRHDRAIFIALNKCNALKKKYPNLRVQFSPVCESDAKGASWHKLLDRCGDDSRGVEIIASVGQRGEFSRKFMNEVHGPNRKPSFGAYQYSYDGTSSVDSDVEKDKQTHKDAQIFFFWHPSFNLKYRTKTDPEQPKNVIKNDTSAPKDRICKPTGELIQSIVALAGDKGVTNFPKGWIGKTHADRSNTPIESRAYKPVYITGSPKEKYEFLQVGKVKSSPAEPFNDEATEKLLGWRYYFPLYGYQISTSPAQIIGNGQVLGTVNCAFRDGKFR